ncbi:hypothetical protein Tco_0684376 [Tanacetum coccineum]
MSITLFPPLITGNPLTPRPDISFAGLDEYAFRNKIIESKTTEINKTLDDEDDVCADKTVSSVKLNVTQAVRSQTDKSGSNFFTQTRIVLKNQEPKLKTVVNTGPRVDKPAWDNTKRVKHQKISKYSHLRKTFVPSGVLTRTGLITPVKQNEKKAVHTVSIARLVSTARAVVNTGKGKMDTDLKKSRWVWRPKGNYLDHVSKDSGSFMLKKGNPEILLQDHAVVDSGCSSHMTGNKAYLSDYEDYNGGFVAFGSDPKGGKITGKGKIRTANLDFDDSKANDIGKDFPNPFMAASLPKTIKQSNDPPLSRGYTLGSGEDSLELMELMENCTQIVYIVRKKNREICTTEEGLQAIFATIDGHEKLITADSLRRHLKLEDVEGISSLSNEEIFEHLAHIGYVVPTGRVVVPTGRHVVPAGKVIIIVSPSRLNLVPIGRILSPGVVTPLFESMLVHSHDAEQHQSPSRITSTPSLSQQPTQSSPSPIDGLEKDLQQTKKTYSTALTKLVLRVKKLEYKPKSGKARRKAKIVLSNDEEIAKDSSKQGRKISQIDEDLTISLVQDEGISWIPQEEEVHEKPSDETEVLVQEETPTKIIEEHESGKKGQMEISTANIQVSTTGPPKVSTAVPHVYTRRSAKDKGKAKMEEPATPKKVKKRTQVQLSMDEELARKMEEEERIRFNAEQEARALQEEEEEERLNLEAVTPPKMRYAAEYNDWGATS